MTVFFITIVFGLFFSPQKAFAQIVINEFSSGTTSDWVEIYNLGEPQDISSLKLVDNDGNQKEFPSCLLNSQKTYSVDWSNRLNNPGDRISLIKNDSVIDCVAYGSGPACEGREVDLPFLEATEFGARQPEGTGTWTKTATATKSDNSFCLSPSSTPTPTLTPTPTQAPAPISYSNIYISEFVAYPDSGNEWVELYNKNDSEVNLYGWFIDDLAGGGGQPKSISGTIAAKSYRQFFIADYYFNNDGDDVRLLDGNQNEKDKKSFTSSTKGKSWAKDSLGYWCEQEPTPNSANPECPSSVSLSTPVPTPTLTLTPTPTKNLRLTPAPTIEESELEFQGFGETPEVLGFQDSPSESPIISSQDKFKITSGLFILAGLILLGFSVFFVLKEKFIRQEDSY